MENVFVCFKERNVLKRSSSVTENTISVKEENALTCQQTTGNTNKNHILGISPDICAL